MENKVEKQLVQALLPQGSRAAEMYGLPKNHKESAPFRPIVSACGDPLDKLSWFLERILTQLICTICIRSPPQHGSPSKPCAANLSKWFPPGTIWHYLVLT